MPSAEAAVAATAVAPASVARVDDCLRFAGALLRADTAALWTQAAAQLAGVHRFELDAVSQVDSAGVALLAELAARCGGVALSGDPPGLAELRAAYRLTPALAFVAA